MKQFGGWHFPDHEQHLIEWLAKVNDEADGRLRYQGTKQIAALGFTHRRRVAIDVGAHVGLHSYYLAKEFESVHAFEPVAAHRECFAYNVTAANVTLHPFALGDREGSVSIHTSDGSSGDSYISGAGDIPLKRLDDLGIHGVSYIKLDCEGGELPALMGAEQLLLRDKPCVMVEQKPGRAQKFGLLETGAVDYLRSLGAHLRTAMAGDYVLSWD